MCNRIGLLLNHVQTPHPATEEIRTAKANIASVRLLLRFEPELDRTGLISQARTCAWLNFFYMASVCILSSQVGIIATRIRVENCGCGFGMLLGAYAGSRLVGSWRYPPASLQPDLQGAQRVFFSWKTSNCKDFE
jgi:hypothetical protein